MTNKITPIEEIRRIKIQYTLETINEERAIELAKEPLKKINEASKKIALKFGKKHKPLTFSEAMRIRNFY